MRKIFVACLVFIHCAYMIFPAHAKMSQAERLWLQCRSCHTLEAGGRNILGPNLYGIVNAPAGTRADFAYSTALKESGLVWDVETLDRWIEQPNSVLKGHRMVYIGMKNADKRAALIAYISEQTGAADDIGSASDLPE